MTPANIVGMAAVKELDVIALTDHNSCKNCQAICKWAAQYDIVVLPGMELTTEEEVHVLCLFATLEEANQFGEYVYARLNKVKNREDIFGQQLIYNGRDEISGREEALLIQSTSIRFDQVYDLMEQFHGVMVPAHIDRNSNSLLYNLGFIPADSKFRCVECKNLQNKRKLIENNPYLKDCLIISDSDAHTLTDIYEPVHFMQVRERTAEAVLEVLRNSNI